MKIIKKTLINIIVPLLIIVLGISIFNKMKNSRQAPKKIKIKSKIPLVKVDSFKSNKVDIVIQETGTVYFPDYITLIPRVSGEIIKLSKKFFIGGFIKKGDVVAILDQSDYKLNLEIAEAEVLSRKTALEKEEEEAKIARLEWELYKKKNPKAKASPLRLRIPQVNTAKAALKSAQANMKKAKLNLSRTYIRSPFNSKVKSKLSSKGQYVSMGSKLGILQSIEKAYVKLYLKDSDIKYLPSIFKDEIDATVNIDLSGKIISKKAKLISWSSELDPKTKMLEAIVEIKSPYASVNNPIISGSFAEVEITGKTLNNVFKVPEYVVHDSFVYIYENGLLLVKKINVIKQYEQNLFIRGITEKDKVIITPVTDVINKMKVKLEE